MEVNPYSTEDKEQRRRVIIVATTIAIIILGIAVWSIIAIVGGAKKNTDQVASTDNQAKTTEVATKPTEEEAPKTEGVSTSNASSTTSSNANSANSANSTSSTATSNTAKPATTTSGAVPETGPEEILPLALVLGCAAAYVSSKKLAFREA